MAETTCLEHSDDGLSEDDLRIATSTIYSQFRGHFRGVTQKRSQAGQIELFVWATQDRGPLFRICQRDGQFLALDKCSEKIAENNRLEGLLEALRARYPPMSTL